MDVEPTELVRRTFERWNAGDFEIREDETHPDIEIHSHTTDLLGEPYRGFEGVRRWVKDVFESFDEWEIRLDDLFEFAPRRLLGTGHVHLRGRGSGVDLNFPCAWIFDFEDGACRRMDIYLDRVDDARAAAGGAA